MGERESDARTNTAYVCVYARARACMRVCVCARVENTHAHTHTHTHFDRVNPPFFYKHNEGREGEASSPSSSSSASCSSPLLWHLAKNLGPYSVSSSPPFFLSSFLKARAVLNLSFERRLILSANLALPAHDSVKLLIIFFF